MTKIPNEEEEALRTNFGDFWDLRRQELKSSDKRIGGYELNDSSHVKLEFMANDAKYWTGPRYPKDFDNLQEFFDVRCQKNVELFVNNVSAIEKHVENSPELTVYKHDNVLEIIGKLARNKDEESFNLPLEWEISLLDTSDLYVFPPNKNKIGGLP